MAKKRVVIFDDEVRTRITWEEKLRNVQGFTDAFEVRRVEDEEFKDAIEVLRNRRRAARAKGDCAGESVFDEASILIVDYDLLELTETTGEEVAYLARCYSRCGTIVGVNQFAREGFAFDLTLRGHPESFADLNLLADQVFEPGLWCAPWSGFRPWYWPLLPRAVEALEKRVKDIADDLNTEILEFLGIPKSVKEILPLRALEFLGSEHASFRSFVEKSGNALRPKDKPAPDLGVARVAAARLSKWLERLVLPGQSILVDAPHLLERFPSLFKADSPEELIGWPHTHELIEPGKAVMDVAKLKQFRFEKRNWLSRSAWYWPLVSESEKISEVVNPWAPRPELAFCEDTSRFADPGKAHEFVAMVDSPFARRFVSTRNSKYGPQLQFAL
jgi:hypothetical protein